VFETSDLPEDDQHLDSQALVIIIIIIISRFIYCHMVVTSEAVCVAELVCSVVVVFNL